MAHLHLQMNNGQYASAATQTLWNLSTAPTSVSARTKLPTTSSARLSKSTAHIEKPPVQETILYLAYGSNLSAETFKGSRGIKPLSTVNVHVPSLDLTFDLAGLPYKEPCFANTRYRKNITPNDYHKDRWHKGLIGVVYEVTLEDYRTIIATEGGGASYQDVLVQCYVVPPGTKAVDPVPSGTPFEAHTLLAPSGEQTGKSVLRPDPSYAQASARYLKLITDGAEEHELPAEYMAYLYNIRPYTITTYRQSLGQALLVATWAPFILLVLGLAKTTADKDGKTPTWLVKIQGVLFQSMWDSYDIFYKKAFGDGERTIGDSDEGACVDVAGCEKGIRLDT